MKLTKNASRGPAFPKMKEKATQLARAALTARVRVAPTGSRGFVPKVKSWLDKKTRFYALPELKSLVSPVIPDSIRVFLQK